MAATFHGVVLYNTSNQVITPPQSVSFDTAQLDTDSLWSAGSPTLITLNATDKWAFGFNLDLDPINVAAGDMFVALNGTTGLIDCSDDATRTLGSFSSAGVWNFTSGDTLEIVCEWDATVLGSTGKAMFWAYRYA